MIGGEGVRRWQWSLLTVVCALGLPGMAPASAPSAGPEGPLRVLGDDAPRAFFFRQAEGLAARRDVSYQPWEQTFDRLMGIEGKVLDEEIVGRSVKNIEFFTRFKHRHPDQLVLLHFNGNARDPRWESDRFFAGHWVYHSGTKVTSDIPAEAGETEIRVANASLFKVRMGRYRNRNEDVGLCMLDGQG